MTARILLAALLCGAPASVLAEDPPAKDQPVKKKAPAKKPQPKGYDYGRSRYKSRDLAEGELKTYRFNEKGEPVLPKDKAKKGAAPAKKRSEPPEEKPLERGCSEEKPCSNPDEAEAL